MKISVPDPNRDPNEDPNKVTVPKYEFDQVRLEEARQRSELQRALEDSRRPEDDPQNWFSAGEVTGPAIITAILGDRWVVFNRPLALNGVETAAYEVGSGEIFHKLFLPVTQVLRQPAEGKGVASGYRLPPKT